MTIDMHVLELGLPPPTRIKIDIDGLEADVFRGAPQMPLRPSLRGLLLELNVRRESDMSLVEHLGSLGLRVAHKDAPVVDATGRAKILNFVFARD